MVGFRFFNGTGQKKYDIYVRYEKYSDTTKIIFYIPMKQEVYMFTSVFKKPNFQFEKFTIQKF